MGLTKDRYKISCAALQNLSVLINHNLERINEYVQELEKKMEKVKINSSDITEILYKTSMRWTCPCCQEHLIGMDPKSDSDRYNFCPHCGIGLEWVD